jgi:Flp pilus assembly protein TadD
VRPEVRRSLARGLGVLLATGLVALSTAGCLRKGLDATGSIDNGSMTQEAWRRQSETWGERFNANPADPTAALNYSRALRALDQHAQAAAVLQQAAIHTPNHPGLLAAYGKTLAEIGRYKEASDVLSSAHSPERPDWRILSAQGAIADQIGEHARAQEFYRTALKIAPGEPTVLSNLGLSYALSKRLPEAERVLREASAAPGADLRMRQNLALVLGLQGRFNEAEEILQKDMAPAEVAANVAALRNMVSQPNSWNAIRHAGADKKSKPAQAPKG